MATKFLKDNSGNAVHMPQQTNFYRQMFKITCLEGSKTNQAGGNAVGFNRTPFQQVVISTGSWGHIFATSWCDLDLTFDLVLVTMTIKMLSRLYLGNCDVQ